MSRTPFILYCKNKITKDIYSHQCSTQKSKKIQLTGGCQARVLRGLKRTNKKALWALQEKKVLLFNKLKDLFPLR